MAPSPQRPGKTRVEAAPPAPRWPAAAGQPQISCRATNPLSLADDLGKVFLDEHQAKATTATRLFRNPELFGAVAGIALPAYLENPRGNFSMWSTGCSSGEEVYSMAMIALGEFERLRQRPRLEVFGTDINQNRIAEARLGVYTIPTRDALGRDHWRLLSGYAEMDDHQVRMGELLRSLCRFALFDMRNRPKRHVFNFIACNHVMQYYDVPGQRHIIANLTAVLKPGGHLYLEGVTEAGLSGAGLKKLPGSSNLYSASPG